MNYTQSDSYVTDVGTSQRMHLQAQAVPTAVSDDDMNGLIWELLEVIKAGGVTPVAFNKATLATYQQLLTALPAALASRPEMAKSLVGNGYQKFPGGLILQWGNSVPSTTPGTLVTFPIAFPTAFRSAVSGGNVSGGPSTTASETTTNFRLVGPGGGGAYWFALGH